MNGIADSPIYTFEDILPAVTQSYIDGPELEILLFSISGDPSVTELLNLKLNAAKSFLVPSQRLETEFRLKVAEMAHIRTRYNESHRHTLSFIGSLNATPPSNNREHQIEELHQSLARQTVALFDQVIPFDHALKRMRIQMEEGWAEVYRVRLDADNAIESALERRRRRRMRRTDADMEPCFRRRRMRQIDDMDVEIE